MAQSIEENKYLFLKNKGYYGGKLYCIVLCVYAKDMDDLRVKMINDENIRKHVLPLDTYYQYGNDYLCCTGSRLSFFDEGKMIDEDHTIERTTSSFNDYYLCGRGDILEEMRRKTEVGDQGIQFLGLECEAKVCLLRDYNYDGEGVDIEEGEKSIGGMIFDCESDEFLSVTTKVIT